MDVNSGITEPTAHPALLTLGKMTSARQMRQPSGQVDFACLNQGDYHPHAGGQMSQMSPFTRLTKPSLQGIVEVGVFFTAFMGLSSI